MAKKDLSAIEAAMEEVTEDAAMQHKTKKSKKVETFETPVRGIPLEYKDLLKSKGHTVAGYMKIAMTRCMKEDGYI